MAATAVARSKDTYLAARYRRLVVRRGKRRALVAVGHSILISIWHILTTDQPYQDLGGDYFLHHASRARQTRRLLSQLTQLGYHVTLQPAQMQ